MTMVDGGCKGMGAAILLLSLVVASTLAAQAETSDNESKFAFKQGVISGTAEACGLDWQALSFRPMMAYWRRIGKSEKDTALLAAMHGAGQGYTVKELSERGCTDAMRRKIRSQLPFKR